MLRVPLEDFDFSIEHPLVHTILGDGAVSLEGLDMRLQTAVDDIYSLGDLLDKVQFFLFQNARIAQAFLPLLQMQCVLKVIVPLRG